VKIFISLGFAGWSWNSVPSVLERVPGCWMGLEYHVNFTTIKGTVYVISSDRQFKESYD